MVTLEHSAYLTDDERKSLTAALCRLGFEPLFVAQAVDAAGRLRAVAAPGTKGKK